MMSNNVPFIVNTLYKCKPDITSLIKGDKNGEIIQDLGYREKYSMKFSPYTFKVKELPFFYTLKWWYEYLMHQSIVTTAPTGLGNSGDFNFSWCKAPVNALHCGAIFLVKTQLKAPLKSRQVNVKIVCYVKTWSQKPDSYLELRGYCWG